MGLLLLTAILCAQLQKLFLAPHLAVLVFVFITVLGLLFSTLFAWLQLETQNTYTSSWCFAGFLALSLGLGSYLDHQVYMDLVAAPDTALQLSLYQKIVSSDLSFWFLFVFPFLFSVLSFSLRTKARP